MKKKQWLIGGLLVCCLALFIIPITQKQKKVGKQVEEKQVQASSVKTDVKKLKKIQFDLNGEDPRMQKADGWSNGEMFNNTWRAQNIGFQDGHMKLSIDLDGPNAKPMYSGGEYRTNDRFHYGFYEVRMKPIQNDGVVSSFFTYTGPSDKNPWDEIDIEFLGKNTTQVQFNYYTNGKGQHEKLYDLGFDATQSFHTYGFEWLPNAIHWFVDGKKVYSATTNIPTTPGKVMMNVWPGINVDAWLNPFNGKVPLTAEYDWFRVTPYQIKN